MPHMLTALLIGLGVGLLLGWAELPVMVAVALPLAALLAIRLHFHQHLTILRSLLAFLALFTVAQLAWGLGYVCLRLHEVRGRRGSGARSAKPGSKRTSAGP